MITPIAYSLFGVLAIIAALHFLWASGSTWPFGTQEQFVRSAIGMDSPTAMPGTVLTVAVATLILLAGTLALWGAALINLPLPEWSKPLFLWTLFTVFLLRGLSAYALPNLTRTESFKKLDRQYYAPLCLVLAGGYLSIALDL